MPKQPTYHVACGLFDIYAGTFKKPKENDEFIEWASKTKVTDEAINAVRDYMVQDCLGGIDNPTKDKASYCWDLKDGRKVTLSISIS